MSVELDFCSLIIPIDVIKSHYPGGFKKYKSDKKHIFISKNYNIWFDDDLVKEGSMGQDFDDKILFWEKLGVKTNKNDKKWKHPCVVAFTDPAICKQLVFHDAPFSVSLSKDGEKSMDKEWEFIRHAGGGLIKKLKKEPLWKKLEADCKKGDVYLAIRNGYISFYHKGGSLFKFEKDLFSTHVKYATIIDTEDVDSPKDYIREDQLAEKIPKLIIKSFTSGYEGIKKTCELYSGLEANGVANLYQNSSYLLNNSIFVLDIEIAFKKNDGKQDRIDILLYDNDRQILRFVEAKLFSNKELWSTSTPPVIKQIKKYEEQIVRHKEELINQYGQYIDELNQIFGIKLNKPKKIEDKVSLLIFGFDEAQKRSARFKDLIKEKNEYKDIPIYCIGNQKDLLAEKIWKGAK